MASGERGFHFGKKFFKWNQRKKSSTDPDQPSSLNSRVEQTPNSVDSSSSCKSEPELHHDQPQAAGELQANVSSSKLNEHDLKEKVKELTVADVDVLLRHIEAELERLDPSHSRPNLVTSVLPKIQTQKEVASCFVQTLPQDLTKEVIGAGESIFLPLLKQTLGGMGGVHWAGLGLSFIAWSLGNMNRTSQNHENCLSLLRKVVSLLSNTRNLIGKLEDNQDDEAHYMQDLQGSTELALQCAIVCSSSLDQPYIKRFFKATSVEEVISALGKELDGARVTNIGVGVNVILDKMPPKDHSQIRFISGSENTVGGVEELQTIFDYLNKDCNELVAVCLHGMGGIGKSTRAKSIYQKFEAMEEKRYCCCRVHFNLEAKNADLPNHQWEILQKISDEEKGVAKFSDAVEGQEMMKCKLSAKRGAIVLYLDNLMEAGHLIKLLPESSYFPPGSKLLITTRNKNVFYKLKQLKINHCQLFEIKKLGIDDARELFFKSLGRKSVASKEGRSTALEELEDEVLKLCDGLPLALEVVSSYIANSDQDSMDLELWKEVVQAMKQAMPLDGGANDDLYSILKFSIDQLEPRYKSAFLDIVAFAVGKTWEYAERLVEDFVLKQLSHRSLIQKVTPVVGIEEESYDLAAVVGIHDVIYAMGKQMARDEQREIRITCAENFRKNAGSWERIVGLSKITLCEADILLEMPQLRVLDDVIINVEWSATQFQCLKATGIRSSIPRPMNFNACSGLKQLSWCLENVDLEVLKGLTQLEALELRANNESGQLANVEAIEGLKYLKDLELHGYANFQSLPKGITRLKDLTRLRLIKCESLESFPKGISCLTRLTDLVLRYCVCIQDLPEEISNLSGLEKLILYGSNKIRSLPEGLTKLVGLRYLDVGGCSSLESLPQGIVAMTGLDNGFASFVGCFSLTLLPEGTPWRWVGLRYLNLSNCRSLQRLPEEILGLTKLERINLSDCRSLRSLPEGIARLSKLRQMTLDSCVKLEFLPEGITGLTSLEKLWMSSCYGLQSLPKGPASLKELRLNGSMQSLPKEIANFTNLEELDLTCCRDLKALPEGIACFSSLRVLHLVSCKSLESLPQGIAHLRSMEKLVMSWCAALKSLPEGIAGLSSLRVLDLNYCRSLESLPQGIAHLKNLEVLSMVYCKALKSLPEGIGCSSSLRLLDLSLCESLESLPQEISNLSGLEKLYLLECVALKSLPEGIACLSSLQVLYLVGCVSLESLPQGIVSLTGLTSLDLKGCRRLKALPEGLIHPHNEYVGDVEAIDLSFCTSLERLPEGAISSPSLRVLDLNNCHSLQWLPEGAISSPSLRVLDLDNCHSLQWLPEGISSLTSLQKLRLRDCRSLQGLASQEIAELKSLEVCDLSGCKCLKSLPEEIANWSRLEELDLHGCENLESLPQALTSLTALRTLDLSFCWRLRCLPNGMAGLTALDTLRINGCPYLL